MEGSEHSSTPHKDLVMVSETNYKIQLINEPIYSVSGTVLAVTETIGAQ